MLVFNAGSSKADAVAFYILAVFNTSRAPFSNMTIVNGEKCLDTDMFKPFPFCPSESVPQQVFPRAVSDSIFQLFLNEQVVY